MILDYLVEFGAAEAVTTSTGDSQFGDSIDLTGGGATAQSVSRFGGSASKQMYCVITVTEAFTSGGSATVAFKLMTDAQDPVTPASATEHLTTEAYDVADLTVGKRIVIPLPEGQGERYLALVTSVATAALTAGSITAGLTYDPVMDAVYSYPDAVN